MRNLGAASSQRPTSQRPTSGRPASEPAPVAERASRAKPVRDAPVLAGRASAAGRAPLGAQQLQALVDLKHDDSDKRRRRLLLVLFLPFLLLLAGATPLLHERDIVAPHHLEHHEPSTGHETNQVHRACDLGCR